MCGVTARIVVEGNMGAIGAILRYGDKPAIRITEPAVSQGDKYVLNGTKHCITGGGTAQMLRNLIAGQVLERKIPHTRDGYAGPAGREAAQ